MILMLVGVVVIAGAFWALLAWVVNSTLPYTDPSPPPTTG